ncbi:MAG: putative zinc-binding metallopeptidase, partial [Planctomycetota bacterium]
MAKTTRIKSWEELTDEEILQMRIRDLNVQIASSALEPLVENLYDELDARGMRFRPPCYLADEWLCPDKVPIMGIPFCLVHPRLKRIEHKMMFDVEGGT